MKKIFKRRVPLTAHMSRSIRDEGISRISNRTGLSYHVIYNLAHARVKSVALDHHRRILGREAPEHDPQRVDPTYFRDMVRLWLFLNDRAHKSDLFKEFYPEKKIKKTDYRIFSGSGIGSVEYRLERVMEIKLLDQGLTAREITDWINEIDRTPDRGRVTFEKVKPILSYLEKYLQIHPSRLLRQSLSRYESGELKTVSGAIYKQLLSLKKSTAKAYKSDRKHLLETLREGVYGEKKGLTLFSEVEEELDFLKKHSGVSVKKFLGRGIRPYKKKKVKRIASWRVNEIRKACAGLIHQNQDLGLLALPRKFLAAQLHGFITLLKQISSLKMCSETNKLLEKSILTPVNPVKKMQCQHPRYLVAFDEIFQYLDMKKKAFDTLVANNCEIFDKITIRQKRRWYIPRKYLNDLKQKQGFSLVRNKYEFLTLIGKTSTPSDTCLN